MNRKFPRIRVHFSFLVFTALIFLLRSGTLILSFSTACAIHEAGHILAAQICGKYVTAVDITGFGIRMETDKCRISTINQDALILLSGPALNIAVYILLGLTGYSGSFRMLNLAAAFYNLLPYRQLDGGAFIALFTEGTLCETAASRLLNVFKLLISLILLILTIHSGMTAAPLFLTSLILLLCDAKKRTL